MSQDPEQKLKLSASNIIALIAVTLTAIGGYININATLSELKQRIATLEKGSDDTKAGFSKFDFKLDKITESLTSIKVEMAGQRRQEKEQLNK